MNECIRKMRCVLYTIKYDAAIKRNTALSFTTQMELEVIRLSERSQTEKGKYCKCSLTYSYKSTKAELVRKTRMLVVMGWGEKRDVT